MNKSQIFIIIITTTIMIIILIRKRGKRRSRIIIKIIRIIIKNWHLLGHPRMKLSTISL